MLSVVVERMMCWLMLPVMPLWARNKVLQACRRWGSAFAYKET